MSSKSLKYLKSGSDIRGIAIGKSKDLTNEDIKNISVSFCMFLERFKHVKIQNQKIAVGHDSRLSSERFSKVVINSLSSIGVDVYSCGLCSTPSISSCFDFLSCCASIEITASHLSKEYNGMKFFNCEGGLSPSDIDQILEISENEFFPKSSLRGTVHEFNLMTYYCRSLKDKITTELQSERPLEGLNIVVDASNGAGGFFASEVLNSLGANTYGSKLLNPDGNFPEHPPNPEKEESIESIVKASVEHEADLGIIFDADVDRCFFVDDKGNPIIKNRLIALISKFILNDHPGSTIVTDSVTSDHLKDFIKKNGGFQFRDKRGYHNVISAAKELNKVTEQCYLAIETSGHAAFKENKFKDDGAYLAVKVIIELVKMKKEGKKLSNFLENFIEPEESKEVRISCENISEVNSMINYAEGNFSKIPGCSINDDTPEGVRLNFENDDEKGWCLIRKSAHDLSVVINIESDCNGGAEKIFQNINELILTKKNNGDII